MDKYPKWFLTSILTFLIIESTQSQSSDCVNQNNVPGQCVNLRLCRPFVKLILDQGYSALNVIRESGCGFEGKDILVCCPSIEETSTPEERPSYGPLLTPQCGKPGTPLPKVVGGTPALLGNWPWMAALGYRLSRNSNRISWLCGGSLISSRHVLTGAHCITRKLYIVRLGDLNLDDTVNDGANPMDMSIDRTDIHPDFDLYAGTSDIAIIRLAENVQFTANVQPICLPFLDDLVNANFSRSIPFIAGWGSTYFKGRKSKELLHAQVGVTDNGKCGDTLHRINNKVVIDDRVICAGDTGITDTCAGDSGGPLMYPVGESFYVIGVVAYGFRCAEAGVPGVYTKVSSFKDFIRSKLN